MKKIKLYMVYKHTNKINNKCYIGITKQTLPERWGHDGKRYSRDAHNYLYSAIKKYGWDNFLHEILYVDLSAEEAKHKEIELISYYKSHDREYGYNLTSGGDGVRDYVCSEETKEKIRQDNISNPRRYWLGKKREKETIDKIRLKRSKQIITHEQAMKSIETRRKNGTLVNKHVYQYTKDFEFIAEWPSLTEASYKYNIPIGNITKVCQGIRKRAGGYIWRYKNNEDK